MSSANSCPLNSLSLSLLLPTFFSEKDTKVLPSWEGDDSHMFSSSSTLSRRPRGFSDERYTPEQANSSIFPGFLRELTSRELEDSLDEIEMNGNGIYMNGQGGRYHQAQLGNFGFGSRGKLFKILSGIIAVLTLLYFFLPWSPSLPSIGTHLT